MKQDKATPSKVRKMKYFQLQASRGSGFFLLRNLTSVAGEYGQKLTFSGPHSNLFGKDYFYCFSAGCVSMDARIHIDPFGFVW